MDDIISLNELSTYLRTPKSTLYKLAEAGKIPSFKVGKELRFKKISIDNWIDREEKRKAKWIKVKIKKGENIK